jgi:hypothetical protein
MISDDFPVGGLDAEFYFSIQLGISSSQLTLFFQRGRLNHQPLSVSTNISGNTRKRQFGQSYPYGNGDAFEQFGDIKRDSLGPDEKWWCIAGMGHLPAMFDCQYL